MMFGEPVPDEPKLLREYGQLGGPPERSGRRDARAHGYKVKDRERRADGLCWRHLLIKTRIRIMQIPIRLSLSLERDGWIDAKSPACRSGDRRQPGREHQRDGDPQ